jgi:isopenicillin N synthase-like dioxygenase
MSTSCKISACAYFQCIVDWAELVTLDLALYDTPGGKEKLAEQLRDAVQNIGMYSLSSSRERQEEIGR